QVGVGGVPPSGTRPVFGPTGLASAAAMPSVIGQNHQLASPADRLTEYLPGRLDSNQRPPEPHSGGRGRENRKNRRFLNLQIPHFPYSTRVPPHFPQNLGSFLPFPTFSATNSIVIR